MLFVLRVDLRAFSRAGVMGFRGMVHDESEARLMPCSSRDRSEASAVGSAKPCLRWYIRIADI